MNDTTPRTTGPSRRPLLLALGGCAVIMCGLLVVGAVGGAWLLQRNNKTEAEPAVEYVLDASPRMEAAADTGGSRLVVAQSVLAEIVRPADPSLTAGLRVFGTGAAPEGCQDTELVVPLAPANQSQISNKLLSVEAGVAVEAALGEAMIAAIRDLSATEGPHTLVVITGGADSCNAEAGRLIAEEAGRAGIKLQTFLVGYQVPAEETEAIRGLVDEAGDVTYLNALDEDELRKILEAIQKYVDDPTTTFPTVTLGTPVAAATALAATSVANATSEPNVATTEPGSDGTPVVVPGATRAPGGYAAQTACDHPYLPLREGASWTYAFEAGTYTWSVTEVTGDLENATAVMRLVMDGLTIDYHWECTQAGLVSYDFGNIALADAGESFTFEVTNESGVWLIPAADLVPGATWANAYTMQSSVGAGGESMSFTTDVSQNFTVVGIESATTEAGTFDTLRVDSHSSYNSTTSFGPGMAFDSDSTMWFAYGVGMIRNQGTTDGTTSTTTLVSYHLP